MFIIRIGTFNGEAYLLEMEIEQANNNKNHNLLAAMLNYKNARVGFDGDASLNFEDGSTTPKVEP